MYEPIFQLKKQPFSISPKVEHYFPAKATQLALAHCKMSIERANGPAIVIGGSGTGKTLVLNMLADDYRQQYRVAQIACSKLDARIDLLQSLLFSLQQPFRDMSEGELRLTFIDFLRPHEACPRGVLLLIDDAHWLNSGLLDELRMLCGITIYGEARCHLIMAGNRNFEEILADPQNDSLNQRIGTRSLLSSLNSSETAEYVRIHLRRAGGGNRQFFTDEALQRIFELTQGVPRVINQLCDNALIVCASQGSQKVDENLLLQAWEEIEQFPALWNANSFTSLPKTTTSDWSVIEFGSLPAEQMSSATNGGNAPFANSALSEDSFANEAASPTNNSGMRAQLRAFTADSSDHEGTIDQPVGQGFPFNAHEATGNFRAGQTPIRPEFYEQRLEPTPDVTRDTFGATNSSTWSNDRDELASSDNSSTQPTARSILFRLNPTPPAEPTASPSTIVREGLRGQPASGPTGSIPSPPRARNPFADDDFESEEIVLSQTRRFNALSASLHRQDVDANRVPSQTPPEYQFQHILFTDDTEIVTSTPTEPAASLYGNPPSSASSAAPTQWWSQDHPAPTESSEAPAPSPWNAANAELVKRRAETISVPFENDWNNAGVPAPVSADDRDLLIVNRSPSVLNDDTARRETEAGEADGSEQPIGKGKAVRMDYQELFDLLRQNEIV